MEGGRERKAIYAPDRQCDHLLGPRNSRPSSLNCDCSSNIIQDAPRPGGRNTSCFRTNNSVSTRQAMQKEYQKLAKHAPSLLPSLPNFGLFRIVCGRRRETPLQSPRGVLLCILYICIYVTLEDIQQHSATTATIQQRGHYSGCSHLAKLEVYCDVCTQTRLCNARKQTT